MAIWRANHFEPASDDPNVCFHWVDNDCFVAHRAEDARPSQFVHMRHGLSDMTDHEAGTWLLWRTLRIDLDRVWRPFDEPPEQKSDVGLSDAS